MPSAPLLWLVVNCKFLWGSFCVRQRLTEEEPHETSVFASKILYEAWYSLQEWVFVFVCFDPF